MKILMFGWEYPPVKSGGLGTACYGLTKALVNEGAEITFVVPKAVKSDYSTHLNLIDSQNIRINKSKLRYLEIDSLLTPYITEEAYKEKFDYHVKLVRENNTDPVLGDQIYGRNLFEEVKKFAQRARTIAELDDYDLIVGHDWMTVEAGLAAREVLKKPFCLHIHATEFDRTGGNPNQLIYDLEYKGMHEADMLIANSHITKENCIRHYQIASEKIIPIHLAVESDSYVKKNFQLDPNYKNVLFLGRLTMQKGPEYFIRAARKVFDHDKNVRFIVSGDGDVFVRMVHLATDLGMGDRVFFTGFLTGEDLKNIYHMADLYVMTSIAEPFGLTVLEALRTGIPCIIPKTAGIAEILNHVIKIDFWDIDALANAMISVLKYQVLHHELKENSHREAQRITWEDTAQKTMEVYRKLVGSGVLVNG